MTVGGDRETHCGQELLVYHQGVCQGAGTCRQGLVLQWRYVGGYSMTHVQSSSATGRAVLIPDRGSPRQSENQGQTMMYSCISCMIHSCYPPRKVHENWHPCLDQDILETLVWPHVVSPQGRDSVLFCFGMWAYLVDPGLDPLQEEKQARSGPCWASRVYLCQTTRTRMGSLTVSLTPSLNPKMTLTRFLRHVTRRESVYFFILSSYYFYILSSHFCLYFICRTSVHR
jgi:hypothetical protein